ncbi:MAG: HIT domain-containing protein [bacterium]|nr:HIT domain-containing protein [bacterium]
MKKIFAPWRMEYIASEETAKEKKCIFCFPEEKYLVYKGKDIIIVMNKYPYTNGHIMVAPTKHGKNLDKLTEKELASLFKGVQTAYKALTKAYRPEGINVGINSGKCAGAGITSHLHIHLVPRWEGDTNFMPVLSGTKIISEHIELSRERIRKALKEVMHG